MINYVIGDATKPIKINGNRIIAHICNNGGGWGSGFVVSISKCWSQPEKRYREWCKFEPLSMLGKIQLVPVKDKYGRLYVANMVAQHKFVTEDNLQWLLDMML